MQRYFFIREKGKYVKVNFSEISYVEACGNYLKIVTDIKRFMALFAMKRIEPLLPNHQFVRIHKSYIVSLDAVTKFDRNWVYLKETKLPVGNQFKGILEKYVVIVQGDQAGEQKPVPVKYLRQSANAG